jgi:hypothetical protein
MARVEWTDKVKELMRRAGQMYFVEGGPEDDLKPYVVVDTASHPYDVRKLIETEWNLELPKLVISVTGGAQYFQTPNDRLEETFRHALMRVAKMAEGWVISGGTDSGVMNLVGNAVRDADVDVPVIGIAPW